MMMSSNNQSRQGDGMRTGPDQRSRRLFRVLLPALLVIGSLPLLNLAVFNAWAGGGSPSARQAWHARWSDIYLIAWGCCILFAGLSVYWLRQNDDKSQHGGASKLNSPSALGAGGR
jgi:hypothetical protein